MNDESIKDIFFLPLDIPPIPNKENIVRSFNNLNPEEYIWWNRVLLLGDTEGDHPLGSYRASWTSVAKTYFQELIYFIEKYVPATKFHYVHLASANREIPPHTDENYIESPFDNNMSITPKLKKHLEEHEPIGYRFIIEGDRTSLYFCKKFDLNDEVKIDQPKTNCEIPETTDFFLIRNGKAPHGVEKKTDVFRLIGFILVSVNSEKHHLLIKNSLEKFKGNVLFKRDVK